jgi:hypothetical protein
MQCEYSRNNLTRDRWPSTAVWLACWAIGTFRNWNSGVQWGKIFCTGPTRAAKTGQKSTVPVQQTNQGGLLTFVFFESPFTWVSTVSRGHPFGTWKGSKVTNGKRLELRDETMCRAQFKKRRWELEPQSTQSSNVCFLAYIQSWG